MDPYGELKKKLDVKPLARCPRCGSLSFYVSDHTMLCDECGYQVPIKV